MYFFLFFQCKSELIRRSAWNRALEPNQKVRAHTALCSTLRHFINNRLIRAKLREKLPHCRRNKNIVAENSLDSFCDERRENTAFDSH